MAAKPNLKWLEEFMQGSAQKSTGEESSDSVAWKVREDPTAAVAFALISGEPFRIVHIESLGLGFFLCLLGARYEWVSRQRSWAFPLNEILEAERTKGRAYLLALRARHPVDSYLPLATLLEDHKGNWHLWDTPPFDRRSLWPIFTVAAHLLTDRREDPSRFDDYGDFLTLGAPSIVQRHSTERLQKHISKKVIYDRDLCNHCLRCATVCNEMRVLVAESGTQLLGPSEDFCTNCGLCQKRCSYLVARHKDANLEFKKGFTRVSEGGRSVSLYGDLASEYFGNLERLEKGRPSSIPYSVESRFTVSSDLVDGTSGIQQIEIVASPSAGLVDSKPLLVTSVKSDRGGEKAVLRALYRAGLVLQTEGGVIEQDMARAAMDLGIHIQPIAESDHRGISVPQNDISRMFYRSGRPAIFGKSLVEIWENQEVDLILAPFADRLPAELHQRVMEETGRQAHIISPHIIQSLPFTKNPLISQLNSEFTKIFSKHPELMESEAKYARDLLGDVSRNYALIHARYRPFAFASGHSACPTCAEAQVLAVPVYMAMAMSFARGEIPEVYFTCETGCMSETLNKVNEVSQKIPGGRTVFGGGFAFGEAIAMAQDRGVRMGNQRRKRRYVVSRGGDGGAVIGLPAWLNALRQQAHLVRQRYSNVLHFINITDTQVYSNTGGESSATSLLGMGTLTTPIGKFLLGNQNIQWTLINLAAEFPGILVGAGHSGNRVAMQQFWQLADALGQSAIRWDVTPCPETGKFFGEDPDDLAEVMAQAGMIPEFVFVGRFRKRIAPFHPADRNMPHGEWGVHPKPILYWLEKDPRYRPLLRKDKESGKYEPRNLTSHYLIAQLESYRDQLNWQIDLESLIVRRGEEWASALFREIKESWRHYRYRLDQFPYAMIFDRNGELKPEYSTSLEHEMVRRILGWDELSRFVTARDTSLGVQQSKLEAFVGELDKLMSVEVPEFSGSELPAAGREEILEALGRVRSLDAGIKEEILKLRRTLDSFLEKDSIEEELFPRGQEGLENLQEGRRKRLYEILDRVIEERAVAKQVELQQFRLSQQLKEDFLKGGGMFTEKPTPHFAAEREEILEHIRRLGPFSIGVASLAGDRGIAINRIFSHFFTTKGVWAGMAWQFGSSKRGTPVLSATFVDAKPLQRKDAMHSFPMVMLTIMNFEEMKRQPDLFFSQLHSKGFLIINSRNNPEALWNELLSFYPPEIRDEAMKLSQAHRRESLTNTAAVDDSEKILEDMARELWGKPYSQLSREQRGLCQKIVAMAGVRILTVDMDGIMQQVTGSSKEVSNLVAVSPMFRALQELGFPFLWERDLADLTQGFPEAVLKNKVVLKYYHEAMKRASLEAAVWSPSSGSLSMLGGDDHLKAGRPGCDSASMCSQTDATGMGSQILQQDSPAGHLMIMGGTVAGMVLSQIATVEHPLFYVGFPITPAGNPFYAMAEAFANGHPYIVVDEVNPSEKVAAEKLLGIARTGGFLPVTFTASQGWRLFTEIIPQFVGARLEGLFLIAKRALAAPNLNIEESHTDFMSFRDDGGIMLAPKNIQEYIPALYLARLLTHFAKLPVILSIGGITDTHKIGLVKVPPDEAVREWLNRTLHDFDYLEHKLINRQGDLIVHGPSGTSAVYQETQSEIEKAHQALTRILPYALDAVFELTGVRLDAVEVVSGTPREKVETLFILQGSLFPNAVEALQELEGEGWSGMACLSIRSFNPFPEEALFEWFEHAARIVVLDRSNSFGSIPPVASRVFTAYARYSTFNGIMDRKQLRSLVGGLGGREITVKMMRDILVSSHLLFNPPESWEPGLIKEWLEKDQTLSALMKEAAALDLRCTDRHTRVPATLRPQGAVHDEYSSRLKSLRDLLLKKNYSVFLANYGQVEFVGAREVLQETSLLQQIVLYVEIMLARHGLAAGFGKERHARVLLHYSSGTVDHEKAKSFLGVNAEKHVFQAPIDTGSADESSVVTKSNSPCALDAGGEHRAPKRLKPDLQAQVVFDPGEALRIETILTRMVTSQGEDPLFYNPEDYEHELFKELQKEPASPLFGWKRGRYRDSAGDLLRAYQCCYRDSIDRILQREVLSQHHAPELRDLFGGDARNLLDELVERLRVLLSEEPPEERKGHIAAEIERYLMARCFPRYPKSPRFYLEYYRNWVAPDLLQEIGR